MSEVEQTAREAAAMLWRVELLGGSSCRPRERPREDARMTLQHRLERLVRRRPHLR